MYSRQKQLYSLPVNIILVLLPSQEENTQKNTLVVGLDQQMSTISSSAVEEEQQKVNKESLSVPLKISCSLFPFKFLLNVSSSEWQLPSEFPPPLPR